MMWVEDVEYLLDTVGRLRGLLSDAKADAYCDAEIPQVWEQIDAELENCETQ